MGFMGPTLESVETPPTYDIGGLDSYSITGQLEQPSDIFSTVDLSGTPGFNAGANPTDPTNTGDTGGPQNTSTAAIPGLNNPETGGISDFGQIVGNAINTAFASWQLASQPKGTPKTVTTKVGTTTITSGNTGLLSGILGPSATSSNNIILLLIAAVIIIYLVARK